MKTLIISSNLNSLLECILPHGAVSLSAFLKSQGRQVDVLHIERKGDWKRLPQKLLAFRPDVVCISATTAEAPHIQGIASLAKQLCPTSPVLVGGVHATIATDEVLQIEDIDGVCRGEGESALEEFLQKQEANSEPSSVRNFWFRIDGETIRNPPGPFEDLNQLPFMDREAVDYQFIIDFNNGYITTMVGRGCAFNCSICANHILRNTGSGRWVRMRTVENALEELVSLGTRYDFKYINFADDNLSLDREWLLNFCDQFPRKVGLPFDCYCRCDTLDDEKMTALADAGCKHIFLGLESGNDFIRNDILNKGIEVDDMLRVTEKLNSVGIKAVISNIVGLPFETPERFQDTITVNRRIHHNQVVVSAAYGAAPKIWFYTPFPGSKLYEMCKDKGWLLHSSSAKPLVYGEPHLNMTDFTPREIIRQHRRFRYEVYRYSHPFFARLFYVYDSRLVQWIKRCIPASGFARLLYISSLISRRLKPRIR